MTIRSRRPTIASLLSSIKMVRYSSACLAEDLRAKFFRPDISVRGVPITSIIGHQHSDEAFKTETCRSFRIQHLKWIISELELMCNQNASWTISWIHFLQQRFSFIFPQHSFPNPKISDQFSPKQIYLCRHFFLQTNTSQDFLILLLRRVSWD